MGRIENIFHSIKPPLLMVLVQIIFAGVNVMYKLAADDGMSLRLIVVYRFMFATVIMVPLALIFERKSLKKINRKVLLQAFLCGLFGGSLGQNLYLQSLVHTSATFVAAMINLAPAFTFILAICFKMEKLAIRTNAGKAKVCGTLIGIGGAMVFTFYKGIDINIWSTNVNLLKHHHHHQQVGPGPSYHGTGHFIIGAFFGLLSCISFSLWLINQAKMSVGFPYLYSSTALMCLMGSIQGALYAVCTVRDWNQWKLGWNVRLSAVAFVGIMGSALLVFLVSWAVRLKGPLYAAIFNPLGLVFVAIVGSLLLDEKLHLGSIIGGLMIVCGVYVVLWGKAKEMKQKTQLVPVPTVDEESNEIEEDKQSENKETDEEQEHEGTETPPVIILA
ncbi:WAT1-related protein At1g25270-like [Gossypium arboreum]|uniref:WAT1-related protein At1g25270-like n=1 Tax=Gossypium arboreum TaxID=29729 RepID=UPI0008196C4C|nr:WAT1-related protein At1g25270-like [Gossypium arboreum]